MKCRALNRNELHRNDQARPARPARQRPRAWRFRPTRRLTIRALAAGTLICPSDRGPFDPGFGQPAASR